MPASSADMLPLYLPKIFVKIIGRKLRRFPLRFAYWRRFKKSISPAANVPGTVITGRHLKFD